MTVKSLLMIGALGSVVAAGSIFLAGRQILPSGSSRSRTSPVCQDNGSSGRSAGCRAASNPAGAGPRSVAEHRAPVSDLPGIGQEDAAERQPWVNPDKADNVAERSSGTTLALPPDDSAETASLAMLPPDEGDVPGGGAPIPPASEGIAAMPSTTADMAAVVSGPGASATSQPKPEDRRLAKPANPPKPVAVAIPDPVPKAPTAPPARPPEPPKSLRPSGSQAQSDDAKVRQHEIDSRSFVASYLDTWSSSNDKALADLPRLFAPQVHYSGKVLDRQALYEAKRRVAERWPVRSYKPRPGSMNVRCELQGATCTVRAIVDWQAKNPARRIASRGAVALDLDLDVSGPSPLVRSEAGLDAVRSKSAERRAASRPPARQVVRQETRQDVPQVIRQGRWQTEILPRPPLRIPEAVRPADIIWEEDGIGWPE